MYGGLVTCCLAKVGRRTFAAFLGQVSTSASRSGHGLPPPPPPPLVALRCCSASATDPKDLFKQKMQLGFTCRVCQSRSVKVISRHSYEKGVVIVRCSGCMNNHLIADNLGWFFDHKVNLDTIMEGKGEKIVQVNHDDGLEIISLEEEPANLIDPETDNPTKC